VRCLAGHAYPGRPLEVWHAGGWQQVLEVLDEVQTPMGKRFHVVCEGRNEFWLEYDPSGDQWQVTAVTGDGNLGT